MGWVIAGIVRRTDGDDNIRRQGLEGAQGTPDVKAVGDQEQGLPALLLGQSAQVDGLIVGALGFGGEDDGGSRQTEMQGGFLGKLGG